MSSVNQSEELNSMIHSLEEKKKSELGSLKEQLRLTGESMKPSNLIKSAAHEITGSRNMKSYLLKAGIGFAIVLLTRTLMNSNSKRASKNLIGKLTEAGLNKLAANQSAIIEIAVPIVIGLMPKPSRTDAIEGNSDLNVLNFFYT